ncbi:MAG: DNA polymerase III subunit alpha [bacterium]|nr:DNA polymerase III subunit alpha [bacterium]
MSHTNFVHLHVHSEYSLLDGAIKIRDLVQKAHEYKMPAVAITDHGNMFGAIEFYQQAYSAGIKPIIGAEVYIAPKDRHDKTQIRGLTESAYHGTLLVKDMAGYRNLIRLVSLGYLEGFYYKPRVDKELLTKYHEGLIFLSGCVKGEIPVLCKKQRYDEAKKKILDFQKIFGAGNFYLELSDNNLEGQKQINEYLIQESKKLGIPVVATNDVHYLYQGDFKSHDALLCVQTNKNIEDKDRLKFSSDQFYFKTPQEMTALFAHVPEAITNTIEIAKHCNLELEFGCLHLPHYEVEKGYELESYLRKLCYEGLENRYQAITDDIKNRLEYELKIIIQMKYTEYFLIIWDLIQYARGKHIPVGPGRGSAAGSIVAYALGITDIDPLKYNLLFERFLNPERVSMPDIDLDFCYERREEIIEYVANKYGKERVSQIITFGTMMAKAAIRDVGRVLNIPYAEVDRMAKLIPNELNITLAATLERVPEFKNLAESKEGNQLINIAMRLEGLTRHASTHAAGIVISREPLINIVPLYKDPKTEGITTQYDMSSIEKIGLLKMDFLGLKTLTLIEDVLENIERTKNIKIKIEDIPLNDKKSYRLLSSGETIGTFQLESSGMRDLCRRLKPDVFEDLIALVALYRPGPLGSGMVDEFIKNKQGGKIRHLHPLLKPILEETYGVIVYQEQVMQIASTLSKFTLGQSDELRRAMSKKIPEKMEKMRELFIVGAHKNGVDKDVAGNIFELMAKFAEYGFNKSHSAAYALISYRTVYLKTHFPLEFMAGLLTNELGNTDKISFYIAECKKMGIQIRPPDINESYADFTVLTGLEVGGTIRFGLNGIKNVGSGAIASIINARQSKGKFTSLYDFCERVDLRLVNKRVLESLIKCGAFDSTGVKRSQLFQILDHCLEVGATVQKDEASGQGGLFDDMEEFKQTYQELPDIPEWSEAKLLKFEKELLGIYITSHPLAKYEEEIKKYATATTISLREFKDKSQVTLGGLVESVKQITTKNEKQMAFISLEDTVGSVEVVVFSDIFEKFGDKLRQDTLVLVKGTVNSQDGKNPKIIAEEVVELASAEAEFSKVLHLKIDESIDEKTLLQLKGLLNKFRGNSSIYIHTIDKTKETVIIPSLTLKIKANNELVKGIESLIGNGKVWLGRS